MSTFELKVSSCNMTSTMEMREKKCLEQYFREKPAFNSKATDHLKEFKNYKNESIQKDINYAEDNKRHFIFDLLEDTSVKEVEDCLEQGSRSNLDKLNKPEEKTAKDVAENEKFEKTPLDGTIKMEKIMVEKMIEGETMKYPLGTHRQNKKTDVADLTQEKSDKDEAESKKSENAEFKEESSIEKDETESTEKGEMSTEKGQMSTEKGEMSTENGEVAINEIMQGIFCQSFENTSRCTLATSHKCCISLSDEHLELSSLAHCDLLLDNHLQPDSFLQHSLESIGPSRYFISMKIDGLSSGGLCIDQYLNTFSNVDSPVSLWHSFSANIQGYESDRSDVNEMISNSSFSNKGSLDWGNKSIWRKLLYPSCLIEEIDKYNHKKLISSEKDYAIEDNFSIGNHVFEQDEEYENAGNKIGNDGEEKPTFVGSGRDGCDSKMINTKVILDEKLMVRRKVNREQEEKDGKFLMNRTKTVKKAKNSQRNGRNGRERFAQRKGIFKTLIREKLIAIKLSGFKKRQSNNCCQKSSDKSTKSPDCSFKRYDKPGDGGETGNRGVMIKSNRRKQAFVGKSEQFEIKESPTNHRARFWNRRSQSSTLTKSLKCKQRDSKRNVPREDKQENKTFKGHGCYEDPPQNLILAEAAVRSYSSGGQVRSSAGSNSGSSDGGQGRRGNGQGSMRNDREGSNSDGDNGVRDGNKDNWNHTSDTSNQQSNSGADVRHESQIDKSQKDKTQQKSDGPKSRPPPKPNVPSTSKDEKLNRNDGVLPWPSLPKPCLDDQTIALRLQLVGTLRPADDQMQELPSEPGLTEPANEPAGLNASETEEKRSLSKVAAKNQTEGVAQIENVQNAAAIKKSARPVLEHAAINVDQLCDIIGSATYQLPIASEECKKLNKCLIHLMHNLQFSSAMEEFTEDSTVDCYTCTVLSGMLDHLANLNSENCTQPCNICSQVFNLMAWHAMLCIEEKRSKTRSSKFDLCYKVCKASDWAKGKLNLDQNRLKGKVKKYCAKVLGIPALIPQDSEYEHGRTAMGEVGSRDGLMQEMPSTDLSSSTRSVNGNIVTVETEAPNFTGIEGHPVQPVHPPPSVSDSTHVSSSAHVMTTTSGHNMMAVMPPVTSSEKQKLARRPSQRRPPAIPQPIVEENTGPAEPHPPFVHSVSEAHIIDQSKDEIKDIIYRREQRDDKYDTQPTYASRFESVPLGHVHDQEQFMSLSNRPTGVKGVGEVVFGHRSQLRVVSGFWSRKREDCERTRTCPYQHREEGVILAEFRDCFSILRTRYQKHHQWERVTHLGNGMSGKCHLAIDKKTKIKFCCKKIHLLRYVEEELTLWSELHNPYIVRLYGAIRHGVKIYIFSEFIDGGSLAACIEEQKQLGRRLSHWSAINYFQQLLKVLAYLQSKNILHEDIKADNILLRRDTTCIAVTDFGTSRRLQDPKELKNKSPVGSPAHWSPEKAAMEGHGFPSDLWAGVCVLVNMLSGEPPWVRRFQERAAVLNFIIYFRPPPMEDVPANVQAKVRDLIEKGFVKDPQHRPSPSVLLQHPAFSILDEASPETFFSTLLSQAHSIRAAVRNEEVEVQNEQQQENSPLEAITTSVLDSTSHESVLFEVPISSSRPYQDSDPRQEQRTSLRPAQDVLKEENSNDEILNEAEAIIDINESQLPPVEVSSIQPVTAEVSGAQSAPQLESQVSNISDRVEKMMKVQNLQDLLPVFNKIFSDDDSNNSVTSFFVDSCNSTVELSARQTPLQEYRPDEKADGEQVPNLSIFYQSLVSSQNSAEIVRKSSSLVSHLDGEDSSTPLNIDGQVRSSLIKKFSDNRTRSPVNFQLSSAESEECTSADLFDSGPSVELKAEDQSTKAMMNQNSPLINVSSSVQSKPGPSNLQQKKPRDMNPIVFPNSTLGLSHSQSDGQSAHSPISAEATNGKRQNTWSHFSPGRLSQSPGTTPGSATSSRKLNSTSSPNTGTSGAPWFRSSSVKDVQEKLQEKYAKELEESHSSADSEKLGAIFSDFQDMDTEDFYESKEDDDKKVESVLADLRKTIGPVEGCKVTFYDKNCKELFPMLVRQLPLYWKDYIEDVRRKIHKSGFKHFQLLHMDDTRVDLDRSLRTDKIKVSTLDDASTHCCCQKCRALP